MSETMAETGGSPAKKMKFGKLSEESLRNMKPDELIQRVLQLQDEVEALRTKQTKDQSLDELLETVEKLKQQVTDSTRQECMLAQKLVAKDQELRDILAQQRALKVAPNASAAQLQNMMLDPAVNLMFVHLKQEMELSKTKLEQTQSELASWKFTPDSQTGKRLMAKCRMLLQENEELSKNVSTGKIAKLEGDIALKQKLIEEMKKSEKETEEIVSEMDEDMESMQGTVYLLQAQLKEARERLQQYEQQQLVCNGSSSSGAAAAASNDSCNDEQKSNNGTRRDTSAGISTIHSNNVYSESRTNNKSLGRTIDDDDEDKSQLPGGNCRTGNNVTSRTCVTAASNNMNDTARGLDDSKESKRTNDGGTCKSKSDTAYRTDGRISSNSLNTALDNLSNGFVTSSAIGQSSGYNDVTGD